MTPIKWVEAGFVLDHADKLRYAPVRQRGMLPVLTLDQLEAWLKRENHTCPTVASMLAQVQAWRGGK